VSKIENSAQVVIPLLDKSSHLAQQDEIWPRNHLAERDDATKTVSQKVCPVRISVLQWCTIGLTPARSGNMIKSLVKHGNSWALVIDRPILELLRATPECEFEILTDGGSLVLTPVRKQADEKKFQAALNMVHNRFGRAMKRLAE
jgi:antitoxin component of MazEF toxin-antitoxin module